MTHHGQTLNTLPRSSWAKLGGIAAIASIAGVLAVQALAIFFWPEIALFKPLDSYLRSAIFTLVPAVAATASLAWLTTRRDEPVNDFLKLSAVLLVVSIIPDYLLPVPHKTILASTVTAFLHVVAAVIIVPVLVGGYQRQMNRTS